MQHLETLLAPHVEVDLNPRQFRDPEWNRAPPVWITRKWSGEDAPEHRHADARILWSAESLLVRFVCRQHETLIVTSDPQLNRKTIGLWDRDVCEIFIAPEASAPERYFEFEAAPTGEWVDLAINFTPDGRETDYEYRSGMSAAAIVGTGETIVAMRIPWSDSIPKPQRGDAWRVNLFRCVGTERDRYLAWQPTHTAEPNFHVPEVFGWLRFV